LSSEQVAAGAVAPRCTRAADVSVSRETADAGEVVRVRVTPR